jgi:predicted RecA/RadA family phage recombinase
MQNFRKDGKTIKWTNGTGSAVKAGDPVVIAGGKVCVAFGDIATTAIGELKTDGVYEWPKASPLVISQGDKVFWDGVKVTKTVTDTFIGFCHEAATSTGATVLVDIEDAQGAAQMANIALITAANGSDAGTTQTLANATKVTVNALITALIGSGAMAGD